ncbi:MAG: hypothetical protein K9K66_00545 [Desulfarculaceae bacterium]|nr:hypothetical protein [Desulfarculaceae bacterium]MCF8072200.1 hypothetical protein [Desulfarculaceae bacterium]MCF8100121.1 hypothetical protein [Desulfarculaceae bacterium]MCF8117230.1 hypothetical protein [Desulfarculaceae bacterium]
MRVLLVERDASLARLYREELEDAGFGVRVSRDLRGALEIMQGDPAHVLVTDLDTMGSRLEHWMEHLRQVHSGGVVLLASRACRLPSIKGMAVIPKSSDVSGLVERLRSMRGKALWGGAAGVC